MRDRRLQIDDQFIDHAWAEMRKQLDVEMPTKAERRRFGGWWWFGTLGLLFLTAGAGFAIYGKKPIQPAAAAKPSKPIAEEAIPMGKSGIEIGNSDLNSTSAIPQKQHEAIASTKVESTTKFSNLKTGNQRTKKSSGLIIDSKMPESVERQAIANTIIAENKNSGANPNATSVNEEAFVAVVNSVPLYQPNTPIFPLDFVEPSLAIEPIKQKVRKSIEANYMHAMNHPASGGGVGVVITKPLKSSQFNVQFGVGYTFVQQPLEVELAGYQFDGNGRVSEHVVFYGTNNSTAADQLIISNAVVRTSRQLGMNLHYLTIPLRMSYSLTNRLSLRLGFDASVLLKTKSDYVEGGVLNSLSFKNSDSDNFGSSSDNGSNPYNVAPFDLVSTAGIEYKLTGRWSVAAQYRYGLMDVLPKNETADFNRLLQMSVIYQLPDWK